MARCHYNFNSGILASGKTTMAPTPSKTITTWWLASNSKTMPLLLKCKINNQKSKASPTQTWIALGKLLAPYNFAASLFCTAQSLFRTILDPASWWLSQSCDSYAAVFGGSQAKKNYHCMMAGKELENHATVHETSNQQSEKQSFSNTNLDRLGKAARCLQLRSFAFLHCTISI